MPKETPSRRSQPELGAGLAGTPPHWPLAFKQARVKCLLPFLKQHKISTHVSAEISDVVSIVVLPGEASHATSSQSPCDPGNKT